MFYVGHINLVAPDKQLFFQLSVWSSHAELAEFGA